MKRNSSKNADHSAKKRSGFTLVELVVVIAVLAILAGVGAVAYKGYIDYAKKSKDEVLLSAANEAFAAVCEEQHFDRSTLPNSGATLTGDTEKTINGVGSVSGVLNISDFSKAFMTYFAGNEKTELQHYTRYQIQYDGNDHMFTFNDNAIADPFSVFKDSNFKDLGELSTPVTKLNEFINGLLNGGKYAYGNRAFVGKILDSSVDKDLNTKVGSLVLALSTVGFKNIDANAIMNSLRGLGMNDDASYTEILNGLVLSAARDTVNGSVDAKAMADAVWSKDPDGIEKAGGGLAAFPMVVGKLAAYRKSKYATDDFKKYYDEMFALTEETAYRGITCESLLEQMQTLGEKANSDGGWEDYINSEESQKDKDAYLAAMEVLSAHSDLVDFNDTGAMEDGRFAEFFNSMLNPDSQQ